MFLLLELSQNQSAKDKINQVIENMNDAVTNDEIERENLQTHHHGSLYSDYTEKLQSLYPECNYTDDILPSNEVLSEIMSKGHVMHLQFSLENFLSSSQNESQYVTEVLSGRLRLFQIESVIPGTDESSPQVI